MSPAAARRPIPVTYNIRQSFVCHRCAEAWLEKSSDHDPVAPTSLDVGRTPWGLQVWCRRHDVNVAHLPWNAEQAEQANGCQANGLNDPTSHEPPSAQDTVASALDAVSVLDDIARALVAAAVADGEEDLDVREWAVSEGRLEPLLRAGRLLDAEQPLQPFREAVKRAREAWRANPDIADHATCLCDQPDEILTLIEDVECSVRNFHRDHLLRLRDILDNELRAR